MCHQSLESLVNWPGTTTGISVPDFVGTVRYKKLDVPVQISYKRVRLYRSEFRTTTEIYSGRSSWYKLSLFFHWQISNQIRRQLHCLYATKTDRSANWVDMPNSIDFMRYSLNRCNLNIKQSSMHFKADFRRYTLSLQNIDNIITVTWRKMFRVNVYECTKTFFGRTDKTKFLSYICTPSFCRTFGNISSYGPVSDFSFIEVLHSNCSYFYAKFSHQAILDVKISAIL